MAYKYEHQTPWNTWIVVADRAKARIFDTIWPDMSQLAEIASLVHPEATLHVRDTVSDGPGQFRESVTAPHTGEPRTDFAHHMARQFAQQLVEHLETHRRKGAFGHVVLVAPPMMLAALRKQMDRPLEELVAEEFDKDYTELKPGELQQRLARERRPAPVP
jgi:protein required for attachment to host cells